MQVVRMAFLILIGGIFSLNAMQAPRKSRLKPGIYLREVVNNTGKSIKISSVEVEFAPDIFGFRAVHNEDDTYILSPLREVAAGKRTWCKQIVPIPCAIGVRVDETLAGGQLKIESSDAQIEEHYWLIRKWNMHSNYEFNVKRRSLNDEKLVQISHERKTFAPDNRLITFVKIILDKPDLLGIRVSTQTTEYTP